MSLRPFVLTAAAGWLCLVPAGFVYAQRKGLPWQAAAPVLAAILIEFVLYLTPGFAAVRAAVETRLTRRQFSLALWLSAVAPYLIYSIPSAKFGWGPFGALAAFALCLSFWYTWFRPGPAADAAIFLVLAGAVLGRLFPFVFASPILPVRVDFLGQLMLIRTGAWAMLSLRKSGGIGFGFVPSWFEIRIGIQHFLYFLPIGFPLAWGIGLVRFRVADSPALTAVGTFFGILWVVALMEEFFFRGLLQQWIASWTGSRVFALAAASVCFGLAHISFRAFPNWKMAAVAAVAGCIYGAAYERAGGIRAAMVTHALVVTTWRTLFS